MDPKNFDRIARAFGSGQSRRAVVKALAGGTLGALTAAVGLGQAGAASRKRSIGNACASNSDCASGLCVSESRSRKICHCASPADCPQPSDHCQPVICSAGACVDGDLIVCPLPSICQISVACDSTSGTCVAQNQPDGMLCGADNLCKHDICASGTCVLDAPKPQGTSCNDQNACTQTDACDGAGNCAGGNPVTCPPLDNCHDSGTCDTQSGTCGDYPILSETCFIAGVCYLANDFNPANSCQACDPSQSQTSFSNRLEQTICDDGDVCTTDDVCTAGVCAGTPMVCSAANGTASCNAGTGRCEITSCDAGFADCNGLLDDGCETNTTSDAANCGGCNLVCPAGQQCLNSACSSCGDNEVPYQDHCYYLDGSGGACDTGFARAPESVLSQIASQFAGLTYKHAVSSNCCIWTSDELENYGVRDHCNSPGPFDSNDIAPGAASCTGQMNHQPKQLTFCGSV